MLEPDRELDRWQHQWRAQDDVPGDLVKKVESGTRSMRRGVIAEIIVTIVFGGSSLIAALVLQQAEIAVLAIAIWMFIAIAWTASLLLRRGSWEPATFTTAAFLDLSILRCERALHAVTIQAILYVVILTFDLVWLFDYRSETSVREFLLRPMVLLFLLGVTPVAAGAALWYRRRLRGERHHLLQLRRQLDGVSLTGS